MATVLDFSILSSLSVIFIFIAVFIGGWGILAMVNPFKMDDDKKKIYAMLAFALAFLVILSRSVLGMIAFSIPWFTLLGVVAFFMLFFAKMFNPDLATEKLIGMPVIWGFLIFFTAVIVLFAFGATIGQGLLEEQPGLASDADRISGVNTPTDQFVPVDEFNQDGEVRPVQDITTTSAGSGDIGSNIVLTLFHPKILGMLFMMVLATVTILLIGGG